jgi:hypothetical protein
MIDAKERICHFAVLEADLQLKKSKSGTAAFTGEDYSNVDY